MKLMTREFTTREKVLLVILSLILLALCYYQFVDQPVRDQIAKAEDEAANLEIELQLVQAKLTEMRRMREEMDEILAGGKESMMGSYNNSKEEMRILNDVLSDTLQYSISFSNVTRNGDQIRRNFSLMFTTADYDAMEKVIAALAESKSRCLIGDVQCSQGVRSSMFDYRNNYYYADYMTVSATATFFETMVGGVEDAGLPPAK